jgi:hypothetical protein
MIPVLSCTV